MQMYSTWLPSEGILNFTIFWKLMLQLQTNSIHSHNHKDTVLLHKNMPTVYCFEAIINFSTGSRSLKLTTKLSIIFSVNIIDDKSALFVQPRKRYPAAETEIDRGTMVRIKASTKLEQLIHTDKQVGPFAGTTSNIVITANINKK